MKPIKKKQEKGEGPFTLWEAAAKIKQAQLGPGPQIRGLLGPGSTNEVAFQDGYSPFDPSESDDKSDGRRKKKENSSSED